MTANTVGEYWKKIFWNFKIDKDVGVMVEINREIKYSIYLKNYISEKKKQKNVKKKYFRIDLEYVLSWLLNSLLSMACL